MRPMRHIADHALRAARAVPYVHVRTPFLQTMHVLRSLPALREYATRSRASCQKRRSQRMQVLFDQRARRKADFDRGSIKAYQRPKGVRRFIQGLKVATS